MQVQHSLYTEVNGQYGLRPDIRSDVDQIYQAAESLNQKFEPITARVERVMPSALVNWSFDVFSIGTYGTDEYFSDDESDSEDSSLAVRTFGAIALIIAGLCLVYLIGSGVAQLMTASEGNNLVEGLNEKIEATLESPEYDHNKRDLSLLVNYARVMFSQLGEYYRDRDLIPKITLLAGVVFGVAACVVDSAGLFIIGVVFVVGSTGWILFNKSHYAEERLEQKNLLQQVMSQASRILGTNSTQAVLL